MASPVVFDAFGFKKALVMSPRGELVLWGVRTGCLTDQVSSVGRGWIIDLINRLSLGIFRLSLLG